MAVEPKRGCGYRKVGGLYLIGEGLGRSCGRLPLPLRVCPACGGGIKQSRGWTWINPSALFEGVACSGVARIDAGDNICDGCLLQDVGQITEAGLIWIGRAFYPKPEDFVREARELGICRRISAVPRGFRLGEHLLFLGHPGAIREPGEPESGVLWRETPGLFFVFRPTRIDKIVTESQSRDEEEMERLADRGITPVIVPDDDRDHRGTVYDKPDEEDQS